MHLLFFVNRLLLYIDRQLGMLKLAEFYFGTYWLYKHISVDNGQLTEDS